MSKVLQAFLWAFVCQLLEDVKPLCQRGQEVVLHAGHVISVCQVPGDLEPQQPCMQLLLHHTAIEIKNKVLIVIMPLG